MKISKFFWGGGIAPSPDSSPGGDRDTPSPHPTPSAPAAPRYSAVAPRFSRLRRSAFPHLFFFYKLTTGYYTAGDRLNTTDGTVGPLRIEKYSSPSDDGDENKRLLVTCRGNRSFRFRSRDSLRTPTDLLLLLQRHLQFLSSNSRHSEVTQIGFICSGIYITLHYIKSYLECPKSLGPLEHYMRLKE